MIDLFTPDMQFSVNEFVTKADEYCREIYNSNAIPVVIGGTGFYIKNFLTGLPKTPESNEIIREQLKEEAKKCGLPYMHQKLMTVDPESASVINPNDEYRIIRALEVFYSTGVPRSNFKLSNELREEYKFYTVILERERSELYKRIDIRIDKMFEEGLEEEVNKLIKLGYKKEDPGMQAIGYREFFMNLSSVDEIKQKIKHDSHKYAKKQYVYMKGISNAINIFVTDDEKYIKEVYEFIKELF